MPPRLRKSGVASVGNQSGVAPAQSTDSSSETTSNSAPNYNVKASILAEGNLRRMVVDFQRAFPLLRNTYVKEVPYTIRLIDVFIAINAVTAILQILYVRLVGAHPLRSALAGIFCSAGFAIIGVVLRQQITQPMSFNCIAPQRAALSAQWALTSVQPSIAGCCAVQRRGVADEKAVKNRMRSVNAIQKITKAMKMVAASKLRSDQRRREMGVPFCNTVMKLFDRLNLENLHTQSGTQLLVGITSDKGLCGSANSKVAAAARALMRDAPADKLHFIGIGEKIRAALQMQYSQYFQSILSELGKVPLNFGIACVLAERIAKDKEVGSATLLYNKFVSVLSSDTVTQNLLPASKAAEEQASPELSAFTFEPASPDMWKDLYEFYLACGVFQALLEGAASEQAQRMTAMESASKNAGDMLSNLTLSYNKARQMKITMELVENISGANALE